MPRSLIGMALAAAAFAAIAFALIQNRDSQTAAAEEGGLLFPELSESINDVGSITVASAEGQYTLQRGDAGWGVTEKGNYPANAGDARSLLLALKDSKVIEQKTSDPARFGKLGIEEIDVPDSKSIRLTVKSTGGTALADLILGNMRASKGGPGPRAYYLRKFGENTSWLAEADLTVAKTADSWLEKEIVDIARERVHAVRVTHADGEIVYARKPDETATDFELMDVPEGKVVSYASVATSLATGLASLNMESVVPAGEHDFADPPLAVCTFWTSDGLKVTVESHEVESKLYGRLHAEYDEEGPPGMPASGPPAPEGAEGAEGEGVEEAAGPSPDAIRAEAEAINNRIAGWVYVLPSWKKSTFQKRMDEMVKDEEPAAEVPVPELSDPLPLPPDEGPVSDDGHDHDHGAEGAGDDGESDGGH